MRVNMRHRLSIRTTFLAVLGLLAAAFAPFTAHAQMTDQTQTPNLERAGIFKSLEQQIGAGVGDIGTPGSSSFIIARDPARAIRRGRQLFQRKFTLAQGLGPRARDGIGDIGSEGAIGAGAVDSCAGCHARPRGAAGFGGAVATRPDSRDAPHLFGLGLQEMLGDEITADLRAIRDLARVDARKRGATVAWRLSSKGIDYGVLRVRADGTVDTTGTHGVDPDLRVKPFFAHGGTAFIRQFVVGALNDEMGLQAVDPLLSQAAARGRVVTPTGTVIDGAADTVPAPVARTAADDPDHDGRSNEIPAALVDHLEFYLFNYFKPGTYRQDPTTQRGRALMDQVGCTSCHIEKLTVDHDRRVADVETGFDPDHAIFNGPVRARVAALARGERRLRIRDAQASAGRLVRCAQLLRRHEAARPRTGFSRAQLRRHPDPGIHDRAVVGGRVESRRTGTTGAASTCAR
jgi:hypothetical protein